MGRAREGAEGAPRGGWEQGEPQRGAGGLGAGGRGFGDRGVLVTRSPTIPDPKPRPYSRPNGAAAPLQHQAPLPVFPKDSALGALDQDSLVSGTHRSPRKERDAVRFCKCRPGEQNPLPPSWCQGARGSLGPVTLTPAVSRAAPQLIAAQTFCYNKIPVKDLFKIPRYALVVILFIVLIYLTELKLENPDSQALKILLKQH